MTAKHRGSGATPGWGVIVGLCGLLGCDSPQPVRETLAPAWSAIHRAQGRAPAVAVQLPVDELAPAVRAMPAKAELRQPPAGYVAMAPVARKSSFGHAVLLMHPTKRLAIPIYVGGTEGFSIQLRLEGRNFNRPLTHDLLDRMTAALGAKLLRAQVDRLRDGVFEGSVVLLHRGDGADAEVVKFDARPSDAIALAIGNEVPIFVAPDVIREAGVPPDDPIDNPPSTKLPPVAL